MGDEFDGCECVFTHEIAIQRLLNFIRQSQNACTDTYCIDERSQHNSPGTEGNNFTIMTMVMIFALIMYLIRPESVLKLTNSKQRTQGPNNGNGGSTQPPPPPPPAVN